MDQHAASSKPRLLDRVRKAVRVRGYSLRTEQLYVDWVRRYILFHGKRHPAEMGAMEVTAFLTYLAVDRSVSPSTQNQARAALLFSTGTCWKLSCHGWMRWSRPKTASGCR